MNQQVRVACKLPNGRVEKVVIFSPAQARKLAMLLVSMAEDVDEMEQQDSSLENNSLVVTECEFLDPEACSGQLGMLANVNRELKDLKDRESERN